MRVEVMCQHDIEEYASNQHDESSILVSIASIGMPSAMVIPCTVNNINDVLYINFNDTDCDDEVSGGITESDADKIREFIIKYTENTYDIDLIIVNCEAGQSRSAGVAAAIMKYLWNDDTAIFDNRKYTPNRLCYRKVLKSFMYN